MRVLALFSFHLENEKAYLLVLNWVTVIIKRRLKIRDFFSFPTIPEIQNVWLNVINCKEGNFQGRNFCGQKFSRN